jgi:hypothetical protein
MARRSPGTPCAGGSAPGGGGGGGSGGGGAPGDALLSHLTLKINTVSCGNSSCPGKRKRPFANVEQCRIHAQSMFWSAGTFACIDALPSNLCKKAHAEVAAQRQWYDDEEKEKDRETVREKGYPLEACAEVAEQRQSYDHKDEQKDRETAYQAGYDNGFADGYNFGYNEGYRVEALGFAPASSRGVGRCRRSSPCRRRSPSHRRLPSRSRSRRGFGDACSSLQTIPSQQITQVASSRSRPSIYR